ncbi:copper chaperone PCu(A)C [Persephonella sp.]|uniref:copper chaperone PCu(A)C n=1 Tax=Persephonella sp. TaxID=2060922 RepID=UPI0025EA7E58|nr:copper chaperone PCu(A)C [Persephonella sp.]
MGKIFAALLVIVGFVYAKPEIIIEDPWVRAVPPTAKNTALFMVIKNVGDEADILIGVKTNISKMVSIHKTVNQNGVMKMVHVDRLPVPAGKSVVLKPGGYHIMVMGLKKDIKAGDNVKFTLIFEKSGEITIKAPVKMK